MNKLIGKHKRLNSSLHKQRKHFHLNNQSQLKKSWMTGLTSLEVYKSIFFITEENNLEPYADTFDEFSITKLKDELEEPLDISNISHGHLQNHLLGPRKITAFKKLESEKRRTDCYYMLLMGYARSPFPVFESYLRMVVDLDGIDIQIHSKQ